MSPANYSAIQLLVYLVVAIFVVIIGVVVFSGLKKKNAKRIEDPQGENIHYKNSPNLEQQIEAPQPEAPQLEVAKPLTEALSQTRDTFLGRIKGLFKTSELANFEEIEEVLYTSDLGPQTVQQILNSLQEKLSNSAKKDFETVREAIKTEMLDIFSLTQEKFENSQTVFDSFQFPQSGPAVWMIIGVNGAGKTTSIGKISAQLAQSGKKVLVAAGDTFRAAAGGQLKVWTERAQVEIFSPEGVKDPSAVAFDAVAMAKARGFDVVIVDTAGRLHTQANLMEELKKMKRVTQKVIADGPHEVLLVLDANNGQNALVQAKEFHQALGVSGVILTKMDGTAKGGVALGVAHEMKLPIKLIGVGEKINDLRPFSPKEFVNSII